MTGQGERRTREPRSSSPCPENERRQLLFLCIQEHLRHSAGTRRVPQGHGKAKRPPTAPPPGTAPAGSPPCSQLPAPGPAAARRSAPGTGAATTARPGPARSGPGSLRRCARQRLEALGSSRPRGGAPWSRLAGGRNNGKRGREREKVRLLPPAGPPPGSACRRQRSLTRGRGWREQEEEEEEDGGREGAREGGTNGSLSPSLGCFFSFLSRIVLTADMCCAYRCVPSSQLFSGSPP